MTEDARAVFLAWLQATAEQARLLEKNALAALHERNDAPAYHAALREKALLVAALKDEADPFLPSLPQTWRPLLEERLTTLADHGTAALNLDSPFYMFALLYPDDHKEGEPDHIATLIAALEAVAE